MEKYFFNAEIRTMIRNKLGLENNFVLIHVGRFSEEKNHIFLIKLFKQILDQRKDSVLILVGDGNTKSKIINKAKKLNIHDKIIFLGVSANANEILNCADVFIAPSTFEGFGTSLLEAQINGLPCIASKAFPKEVEITSNCFFLSIKSDFQVWKKHILNARRKELYKEDREKLILSDYNIRKTAQFLEKIYLSQ
jgi:glycosyltransferase involved in cell wall biosynthesis